jgi:peptidylprolyl isomerase
VKLRTPAGAVALALAAALTLTACGDDGSGDDSPSPEASPSDAADSEMPQPTEEDVAAVEAITVDGDAGEEPTLSFESFELTAPTSRVVDEGDGEEVTEGAKVTIDYVAYDGEGERLGSTWESDTPESFVMGDVNYSLLNEPLAGQKVGARVLVANSGPAQDGSVQTVVNLVEVVDVKDVPSRAEGEAVEPAAGLPTVTLDDSGKPSVEIPEGYEAPDELVAQPLIEGDGPEVEAGQSVTAQYTGWTLDGEQFDSSWDRGTPFSFSTQGGVIQGWIDGVIGQTVGSQVLLVIPAELAYGEDAEAHELGGETLVFVVDILDAE